MFKSLKITACMLLLAGLSVLPVNSANAEMKSYRSTHPAPLRSVVLNEPARPIPRVLQSYVQFSQYVQANLLESKVFVRLQGMAGQWWDKHRGISAVR